MTEPTTKELTAPQSAPTSVVVRRDFLASIVVFLVALPLCMGVAIASGAPVAAGLITGIVGGILVGLFAGCPLQVSGPAAGLTVIVYGIVEQYGLEMLGLIVLVAGLMQVIAGIFRLGQWFRAVSPAVIQGMLAGIGVLILASQFHVMVDDSPKGKGFKNILYMWDSLKKAMVLPYFESVEARQNRIHILRELGELHRRQVDLRERIAELIPRGDALMSEEDIEAFRPTPDVIEKKLVAQESIATAFDEVAQQISQVGVSNGDDLRAADTAMLIDETKQRFADALDSIRAWDIKRLNIDQINCTDSLTQQLAGQKNHSFAALIGLVTIGLVVLWKVAAPKKLSVIPPPLLAITVVTIVTYILVLPVIYVEVPDNLWSEVRFPSWTQVVSSNWSIVIQQALFIAIVASAETLLCCTAVDQMHTGARTKYDKELFAQGLGNSICGLLGALPMTGVIVRSSANVQAGATTRLSAILHGVWLLVFVVFLAFLLRLIPTAGLAAILVYTGYKLVNFKAIAKLREFGWSEVLIYLVTVVMIVCTDLLTGVISGLVMAAGKLLYTFSHLHVRLVQDSKKRRVFLYLRGAATFIRLPKLASALEEVPPSTELHVDFEHLDYIDHACLDLLMSWARQHQSTGGRLVIDWSSLHARFRGAPLAETKAN
ncbi:MAG TPA: SulP family inorganic anion transporter [Pirellulaceae bacterium]|nr:SulP family inorganic anion transporter [Pirellulaceae bacterium]